MDVNENAFTVKPYTNNIQIKFESMHASRTSRLLATSSLLSRDYVGRLDEHKKTTCGKFSLLTKSFYSILNILV